MAEALAIPVHGRLLARRARVPGRGRVGLDARRLRRRDRRAAQGGLPRARTTRGRRRGVRPRRRQAGPTSTPRLAAGPVVGAGCVALPRGRSPTRASRASSTALRWPSRRRPPRARRLLGARPDAAVPAPPDAVANAGPQAGDAAVTLRPMRWWDVEAGVELERELFAHDPWSAEQFWGELAHVPASRWFAVHEDDAGIDGYVGLVRGAARGRRADDRASHRARRGRGSDARCSTRCSPRPSAAAARRSSSRCASTTRPRSRSTRRTASSGRGGAATTTARGTDALVLRRRLARRGGAGMSARRAAGARHRDLVRRDGVGSCAGTTLLADAVASSVEEHARFGGVVPEVASRAHLEAMVPTHPTRVRRTPASRCRDVDAIAVTAGPGLAGALLVGVAAAKALALSLGKPIYGVNHLAAHVRRRPAAARAAARADDGAARVRRPLVAAARAGRDQRRAASRRDDRRRRGRGVRQGRARARPAVPRRAAHRPRGAATARSSSTSRAASPAAATSSGTASTSPSAA